MENHPLSIEVKFLALTEDILSGILTCYLWPWHLPEEVPSFLLFHPKTLLHSTHNLVPKCLSLVALEPHNPQKQVHLNQIKSSKINTSYCFRTYPQQWLLSSPSGRKIESKRQTMRMNTGAIAQQGREG